MFSVVVITICLSTFAGSALGFGNSVIAVPLLLLVIPSQTAVPLAELMAIIMAGIVFIQDRKHISVSHIKRLLISSIFGLPLGLVLLLLAPQSVAMGLLGVLIIAFAIYIYMQPKKRIDDSRLATMIAGFVSGILGSAYAMNGPPLVIYAALCDWPPQKFRATLQCYFFLSSVIILFAYYRTGILTKEVFSFGLVSVPGAILATELGRRVNRRIGREKFRIITYNALLLLGLLMISQAMHLLVKT